MKYYMQGNTNMLFYIKKKYLREFSIQYIYEACKQSNYPLLRHKSVSALSTAVYKPYTAPAQRQTLL